MHDKERSILQVLFGVRARVLFKISDKVRCASLGLPCITNVNCQICDYLKQSVTTKESFWNWDIKP